MFETINDVKNYYYIEISIDLKFDLLKNKSFIYFFIFKSLSDLCVWSKGVPQGSAGTGAWVDRAAYHPAALLQKMMASFSTLPAANSWREPTTSSCQYRDAIFFLLYSNLSFWLVLQSRHK